MAVQFNPFTGNLDFVEAGAATTPGGSDTQVQFNDGGSFGGSADLTWDDTAKELGVGGDINLDDGGTYETTVQVVTPTANRTISFPDATGTVALVAGSTGQLVYNNAGAQAGLTSANIGSTGEINISLAGAASTPPVSFTGSWFTGTAVTAKPQLLIEPSGTTSTGWSPNGTGFGVNAASGFGGNLLDLQVNGSSSFQVSSSWVTFYATYGIRGSNYTSINGANMTVGPGSKISESAAGTLTIKSGKAWPNATTNIVGGALYLTGGDGASNSLGTANGGDINLDGGQSYGTGTEGNIVIGATRGNLVITDSRNVLLGTTTGTKIGTATTQKLGFYNATPVVQPTAVADATDAATVITQLNALLDRMRDLGLIAT